MVSEINLIDNKNKQKTNKTKVILFSLTRSSWQKENRRIWMDHAYISFSFHSYFGYNFIS